MERELEVFLDLQSVPVSVGRLWVRDKGRLETATFEYDPTWLRRAGSFALSPSLPLSPGPFQSESGLFNAFTDPAPDRWGQKLMRHFERQRAADAGTEPRTLRGMDFLSGVDDETRLGALRFKQRGGEEFITKSTAAVPPLVDLSKLLSATNRVESGKERKNDLALLLAPGGSLGGARPKATVRDRNGQLHLAKFPWSQDDWPVIQWETVTLVLAKDAGVEVAPFRTAVAGGKRVLLTARFDRGPAGVRIPFMSAFTALDAKDHDGSRSYMELVDALRQFGSAPSADASQLWRRMAFNVLVSNTDDHLRNHAFLRDAQGWRLSPAYDMNPCPLDVRERIHQLALNEMDATGSLEIAFSVANYFGLTAAQAREIASEVATSVSRWREVAAQQGLAKSDLDRMATAFQHPDLPKVLATSPAAPAAPSPLRTKRNKSTAAKIPNAVPDKDSTPSAAPAAQKKPGNNGAAKKRASAGGGRRTASRPKRRV